MDVSNLIGHVPLWLILAIVAAPGVWSVITRFLDVRKDTRKERADLIRIAQDAAASVIKDLRAEVESLRGEVAQLEAELAEARQEHAQTIASKDAELSLLRGHLRQAFAIIEAWGRLLDHHTIPHEKPAMSFWRVQAGDYPVEVQR